VTKEEALDIINMQLDIQVGITHRGDELKCWTPDTEDGGTSKTYLDASACLELGEAFATLGATLHKCDEPKKEHGT
jgi:hypothetical protein